MILPIELFDTLIHILRYDTQTLAALALTCKAFTSRAQRRIFYHVVLSGEIDDMDNSNSILLALVNPQHAHLLEYVHSLTVISLLYRLHRPPIRSSRDVYYILNPAVPKFIDAVASQLISLSLKGFAPGWTNTDTTPLRESVTRVFSSPILKHLELQEVNLMPMALLCRATGLTSLRFASPYPSYSFNKANDTPPDAPLIYLTALDISVAGDRSACTFIDWILQADNPSRPPTHAPVHTPSAPSKLSASRLRRLSIQGLHYPDSLWALVESCHATLEHISFGPDRFYGGDPPEFKHGFPSLHTVRIKVRIPYDRPPDDSPEAPLSFFPKFLLRLPPSTPLERIEMEVAYGHHADASKWREMDLGHWETLVSFLLDGDRKFPGLGYVSVGVTTGDAKPDVVTPQDIFPMIEKKFERLVRSGVKLEFYEFDSRSL